MNQPPKEDELVKWNNSRVRGFLSELNERLTPDRHIALNNWLALEALMGLYIAQEGGGVKEKEGAAVDEVTEFFTGRGSMKASEYIKGVNLRDRLLKGALRAYTVTAKFEVGEDDSDKQGAAPRARPSTGAGRPESPGPPRSPRSTGNRSEAKSDSMALVDEADGLDWRSRATCANPSLVPDPDRVFFLEPYREAKAICRDCGVSAKCLEYALSFEAGGGSGRYGIYGGLTPNERAKLARRSSGRKMSPRDYRVAVERGTRPYRAFYQ